MLKPILLQVCASVALSPVLANAYGGDCMDRLVSTRQAERWLQALDVENEDYDQAPEYQFLLRQTQLKLESFGIRSRRIRKRMEDKARTLIEMTDILPLNFNGRLIARARERFGLRVLVDPVMRRIGEGRGATDAPYAPVVYLDFHEVQRNFVRANPVLLHEIRHVFLAAQTVKGLSHLYQGELMAERAYRFERTGFYEDELSFEELTTYAHDAQIARTRFENGQITRSQYLYDLKHLLRIANAIGTQLRMADLGLPARAMFTEAADYFSGAVLVWPVFRDGTLLFNVHLEFPGVRRRIAAQHLWASGRERIEALIAEADRQKLFVQTELLRLGE